MTGRRPQPEDRLKSQIQNPKSQTNSRFKIPNLTWNLGHVWGALLTDVGEPFEGNGDTNEVLGVVLDTYDCGRGFE